RGRQCLWRDPGEILAERDSWEYGAADRRLSRPVRWRKAVDGLADDGGRRVDQGQRYDAGGSRLGWIVRACARLIDRIGSGSAVRDDCHSAAADLEAGVVEPAGGSRSAHGQAVL